MRRAALALLVALGAGAAGAEGLTGIGPTGDVAAASAAFTARLKELHPPGSPAKALRAALAADGFAPEGATAARREEPGGLCRFGWLARWAEDGGVVGAIEGERYVICL